MLLKEFGPLAMLFKWIDAHPQLANWILFFQLVVMAIVAFFYHFTTTI